MTFVVTKAGIAISTRPVPSSNVMSVVWCAVIADDYDYLTCDFLGNTTIKFAYESEAIWSPFSPVY